jgi:hypothetical protein
MSVQTSAHVTSIIAVVGIIINSLEIITSRHRLFEFFNWEILRTRYFWLVRNPEAASILELMVRPQVFLTLLILQIAAAIMLPIYFDHHFLAAVLAIVVLGVHLLIHFRLVYGFDGADQMQTIVWTSLAVFQLGALVDSSLVQEAAMTFLALEVVLAYLTSGVAKLTSPIWRKGDAVGLIIRTSSYGSKRALQMVQRYNLSPILSWATILFEVGGPFLILTGQIPTLAFLIAGLSFHISVALIMGLNSFIWAFFSGFPAILYISQLVGR